MREVGQQYDVLEYNSVKDTVIPALNEGVWVKNSTTGVKNWLIGDGVQTIEELWGQGTGQSQLEQNVNNLSTTVMSHIAQTTAHGATATPTANRAVMFDAASRLKSGAAPVANNDVVRKQELDAEAAAREQADATEEQAREQMDAELAAAISVELQARQNANTLLNERKQDKVPDGIHPLILSNGKINTVYMPDTILGGLKYGGVFNSNGVISASSLAGGLEGTIIDDVPVAYGGYYFISQEIYTLLDVVYDIGDWAVCQGVYSPKFVKIDTSDAVSSVNGKRGTVIINKSDVGLGNVDNTSDMDKPLSTAQELAIATEAAAREQADAAEEQARIDADDALTQSIATEAAAREQADAAEEQARIDADDALTQSIATEAAAREQADAAEEQARIDADEYIQNNLGAVTPKAIVTLNDEFLETMSGVQLIANEGQILDLRYVMRELDHLQEQIRAICAIYDFKFLETIDGRLLKTFDGKYMRVM